MRLYTVTGLAATASATSVQTHIIGDFAAAARYLNFTGITSCIVTIEESPDGFNITDANALWYTLATFATVGGAGVLKEKLTIIDPHFSRMRAVATLVGTGSVDIDVYVEGVEV